MVSNRDKIRSYLDSNNGKPVTPKAIGDALKDQLPARSVYSVLHQLAKAGHIQKLKRGTTTMYLTNNADIPDGYECVGTGVTKKQSRKHITVRSRTVYELVREGKAKEISKEVYDDLKDYL